MIEIQHFLRSYLLFFIFSIGSSIAAEPFKPADANGKTPTSAIAPPVAEGLPVPLSLADAVSLGLRNNGAIRSAYLQRVSQKFDLYVAENRFTPKLLVNTSYLAYHANDGNGSVASSNMIELTPTATLSTVTGAQFSVGWLNNRVNEKGQSSTPSSVLTFTIIQPLLRNAGIDVNTAPVRIARIEEKINLLNLKKTISQSITQIIFAYREFLRAENQMKIAQDALNRSRNLLDINYALVAAGRMAKIDVIQTEADVANQELAVEEAVNQVDAARLALLNLIAIDSRTKLVSTDLPSVNPPYSDIIQALSIAYENQPEYLSAVLSIERARINLDVARNQRRWDLSAVAGVIYNKSNVNNIAQGRNKESYAGLQLAIPLTTDLALEQTEVRASTDLKNQELLFGELRRTVEQRVRDAVRNVQIRWRQLQIAQRARDLSLKKLDAERDKLQIGRSSNFQVLSFESDLRNAENAQLNALIAYLNALTTLDEQQGKTLESWQITMNE